MFPSLKYLEIGEMVAFKVVELGLFLIGKGFLFLWPVEDVLN